MFEGSTTSQRRLRVVSSKNGSSTAVDGSGIRIMSDSWMPFQPAIEEPSKPLPSSKNASSTTRFGTVTCCSLPLVSVKRRSMNLTSLSLISLRTSAAVVMGSPYGCSEFGCPGSLAATSPGQAWDGKRMQVVCQRTGLAQSGDCDRLHRAIAGHKCALLVRPDQMCALMVGRCHAVPRLVGLEPWPAVLHTVNCRDSGVK